MSGICPETGELPFSRMLCHMSPAFRLGCKESMGSKGNPHCPLQSYPNHIGRDSLYANNPVRKLQTDSHKLTLSGSWGTVTST